MSAQPFDIASLNPDASYRGASNGEALPAHAEPTYYDRPLLKKPHWDWEVIAYLFMGGVMGGSGMLVAIADEDGDDAALARSARYIAFALASTCPLILIKHLGRPERFLHMLRIVKFKSVMSMGVWGLIAFSAPATAAAAAQAADDGLVPQWIGALGPRAVTKPLLGAIGAFIAGYTGVLISATAIPVWAIGKRYIPAFSVCSETNAVSPSSSVWSWSHRLRNSACCSASNDTRASLGSRCTKDRAGASCAPGPWVWASGCLPF